MHPRRLWLPAIRLALAILLAAAWGAASAPPVLAADEASGVVFNDRDGDGVRDRFEAGIRGVAVSNGREVVRTDWLGRWHLPVSDDTILFVVKPRGWQPPVDDDGLPRFFYVHKPAGSPEGLTFPGVAPTGPLPDSIDFPLVRRREGDSFRVVLLADPQPYSTREIDFLERDVIAQLEGVDADFALVLGDLVGDDLSLFGPLDRVLGRMGVPWWPVPGNHDMNYDVPSDAYADETWERVYGPGTYAFQVGRAHFLVLDDIVYSGEPGPGKVGPYRGGLSERQLAFVENYLATVDPDDLVVPAMHIPLVGTGAHQVPERKKLLALLSKHPHTLSLSGHTHIQAHHFLGREDGFTRDEPHHHFNVATASGSWWRGRPDETGIPHTTMRDGAPNGYALLDVNGTDYTLRFRAARRPADEQLAIHVPEQIELGAAGKVELVVNVFAGSKRETRVEARLAPSGAWRPLAHVVRTDPGYEALYADEREERPPDGWELPPPVQSVHIWAGPVPVPTQPGTRVLEVRALEAGSVRARGRRVLHFR